MEDGLFLNRVNIGRAQLSIGQGIERALFILTRLADSKLPVSNQTAMAAKKTADLVVWEFFIKKRLF